MQATRLYTVLLMSFLFSATASAQVFDTVVNVPPDPDIGIFESVGGDGLTTQLYVFDGGSIGEGF